MKQKKTQKQTAITQEMIQRGALAIGRLAYKEASIETCGTVQIARKPDEKDIAFYSKYARAVLRANLKHIRPTHPQPARR